jgi:hypothetical protein
LITRARRGAAREEWRPCGAQIWPSLEVGATPRPPHSVGPGIQRAPTFAFCAGTALEGMAALGKLLGDSPLTTVGVSLGGKGTQTAAEIIGVCTEVGSIAVLIWCRDDTTDTAGSATANVVVTNVTIQAPCIRGVAARVWSRRPKSPLGHFNATLGSALVRPRQLHTRVVEADGGQASVTVEIVPPVVLTNRAQETLLIGLEKAGARSTINS